VKAITTSKLREMKQAGEKIASLTAYDASFARLLEDGGVEVILVGDSLGMVVQGHASTLPVTLADMIYHSCQVARGSSRALRVVDMPFMSYAGPEQALANAGRLLRRGGAQAVKLEGGAWLADTIRLLSERGVPVCAHLGLLPQSVHKLGGYHAQGRTETAAQQILDDAGTLEQAGAEMLVLECVPAELAAAVTRKLRIPVIGIGAGPDCDGQVLVLYDALGITPGRRPKFSRDFLAGTGDVAGAIRAFVAAVKDGSFPGPEHCV